MTDESPLELARAAARQVLERGPLMDGGGESGPFSDYAGPAPIRQADMRPPLNVRLDDYALTSKAGAKIGGLRPEMTRIEGDVSDSWQAAGGPRPVITSGNDSTHMRGSRHYRDLAFDLRANDIDPRVARGIRDDLAQRIGDDYQVFYETFPRNPSNNHIHVEYDPRRR